MRRHDSRREKRNQIIISVFIVGLMVFSVLGFIYGGDSNTNKIKYEFKNRTYSFQKDFNTYSLDINNQKVVFYSLPGEIKFNMSSTIVQKIKNSNMVYVTFNPEKGNLEYIELAKFIFSEDLYKMGIFSVDGTTQVAAEYSFPIIDCMNATEFVPVILFEHSNTTVIDVNENCITVRGKNLDFIKFRDLFLYVLHGVI